MIPPHIQNGSEVEYTEAHEGKIQKLIRKYKKAKKAINGALVQVGTAVAIFAPNLDDEYKAGVAGLGGLVSLVVIYYSTNEKE